MACPCTHPSAFNSHIAMLYGPCCGTFLHLAVRYDNLEIARHLILLGSDVNHFSPTRRTPLAMALELNRKEHVNLLLSANANIHIVNDNGLSCLQMALYMNPIDAEIQKVFLHNINPECCPGNLLVETLQHAGITLQRSVLTKKVKLVEVMLKNGYDVHSRDSNGRTALHIATEENNLDMVWLLITNKADINATLNSGTGALLYAARNKNLTIMQILLDRGANPNARNRYNGYTPLFAFFAAETSETTEDTMYLDECAKMLLQYGAIPQNASNSIKTLLEWASEHEESEGVYYLVAQIAILDLISGKKSTVSYNNVSDPDMVLTLESYYLKCQKILKTTRLEKIPLLDLLTNGEHNIRSRVRNATFGFKIESECFKQNLKDLNSYYYDTLMKKIKKVQRTVELEDKAMLVICELLKRDYNEIYLIVRNIVSYLSEFDLMQLCCVQVGDDSCIDEWKSTLKAISKLSLRGYRARPY